MDNREAKIVAIAMFKNESKGIRRMLESTLGYVDYWVVQDNGSTDGSDKIEIEYFEEHNIPYHYYQCEEGWVGFGWNRDHLLQTCLNHDHGCDWILKMDCDEYLEVDDDFDWSPLDDKNIQSFHVTAEVPGCTYYRAWMWNARLPWHFKHDVAHECIVCDIEGVGEDFQRFNLPRSLRQIGTTDGESYLSPTKYISDALKLEDQQISEGTLLEDRYHFWYVGKSYHDAAYAEVFPLGFEQQKEFARRAVFYFKSWMNHVCNYDEVGYPGGTHEMAYFTMFSIGQMYRLLQEPEKALEYFILAQPFASMRNEHLVGLAETCRDIGDYPSMLYYTKKLIQPERKCPFPDCFFLVNNAFYIDTGDYPQRLHNHALELNQ